MFNELLRSQSVASTRDAEDLLSHHLARTSALNTHIFLDRLRQQQNLELRLAQRRQQQQLQLRQRHEQELAGKTPEQRNLVRERQRLELAQQEQQHLEERKAAVEELNRQLGASLTEVLQHEERTMDKLLAELQVKARGKTRKKKKKKEKKKKKKKKKRERKTGSVKERRQMNPFC